MDANSTPTAPAPTTIKVFGISGSWRIERFVRIVLWSGSMPGSDFASDPLTIRMFAASISVFFPSFSTLTRPGPSYLPQPCTHSTLFFLKRNSMRFECFLTILSFRERTLAQLIFSPLTSRPSSPARIAATYPPGPLPIIATAYFATRRLPSAGAKTGESSTSSRQSLSKKTRGRQADKTGRQSLDSRTPCKTQKKPPALTAQTAASQQTSNFNSHPPPLATSAPFGAATSCLPGSPAGGAPIEAKMQRTIAAFALRQWPAGTASVLVIYVR